MILGDSASVDRDAQKQFHVGLVLPILPSFMLRSSIHPGRFFLLSFGVDDFFGLLCFVGVS